MSRHSIDSVLLQNIVSYLETKPFNEVNKLIVTIVQDAQNIQENKEETNNDKPQEVVNKNKTNKT